MAGTDQAPGGFRKRHRYKVMLSNNTGQAKPVDYFVYWDPAKVEAQEVAAACAIEANVFGPRDAQGNPLDPVLGVSAELLAA